MGKPKKTFLTRLSIGLALCFTLLVGCGPSDDEGDESLTGSGQVPFSGEDPRDQATEGSPNEIGGPLETDIAWVTAQNITRNAILVRIGFHGDFTAWYSEQSEKLAFSLQIWTKSGTYIETFFKEKYEMKVSDNKAEAELEFDDTDETAFYIVLKGFEVKDIKKLRVATFQSKPGVGNGRFVDELVIER